MPQNRILDPNIFYVDIDDIQPSQLYICREKLDKVKEAIAFSRPSELKPLPVKELSGSLILTDGHTRAFAASLAGFKRLKVCWDKDNKNWNTYFKCVQWCKEEKIVIISDLASRIIGKDEYKKLWLDRCANI